MKPLCTAAVIALVSLAALPASAGGLPSMDLPRLDFPEQPDPSTRSCGTFTTPAPSVCEVEAD